MIERATPEHRLQERLSGQSPEDALQERLSTRCDGSRVAAAHRGASRWPAGAAMAVEVLSSGVASITQRRDPVEFRIAPLRIRQMKRDRNYRLPYDP
ncbi:MAG: hypothetical protein IT175_14085 [Acidobacteria bacterium]|nr:hypothetical protein [Acidobacteriota bacterium]